MKEGEPCTEYDDQKEAFAKFRATPTGDGVETLAVEGDIDAALLVTFQAGWYAALGIPFHTILDEPT